MADTIRAVIVDDEPPARREMRRLLATANDVNVVGEAGDLDTARGLLSRSSPDVVFLDIRLGRQSGFDLLDNVDDETSVIFVTAHDDFAVGAFEKGALDYLMKPVDAVRLAASLDRLRKRMSQTENRTTPRMFSSAKWIFLDTGEAKEFIELANISHVVAAGGGTRVFTCDGKSRDSTKTLVEWEDRLVADDFARVHRSAVVNLRQVERVTPWFQYTYKLKLRGFEEEVTMSRRHAARLKGRLG